MKWGTCKAGENRRGRKGHWKGGGGGNDLGGPERQKGGGKGEREYNR